MSLTWQQVRDRIRGFATAHPNVAAVMLDGRPMSPQWIGDALQCATSVEAIGLRPPDYAFRVGGHFTLGWVRDGHTVEFRSDGTCHASFREPKPEAKG